MTRELQLLKYTQEIDYIEITVGLFTYKIDEIVDTDMDNETVSLITTEGKNLILKISKIRKLNVSFENFSCGGQGETRLQSYELESQ